MNDKRETRPGDGGADAMARVVEAERLAAERIAAARREAEEILAAAREAGRLADERADRRVQKLHACARKALKERQGELDELLHDAEDSAAVALTEAEIDTLVTRMARRLTGLS
ncbi:MAG: hypothetical protein R3D85_14745 [Paracoccaceae bacterium]|jgi:vacuolar-type H+-ATPase subunit H